MHIEHIQEDADPDTTILDESGLEFLFDGDHFSVTRRQDDTRTLRDHSGWIAKEPRDEERQDRRSDCGNDPAQPSCQQCNADSRPDEGNSLFGKRDADGTIRHRVASGYSGTMFDPTIILIRPARTRGDHLIPSKTAAIENDVDSRLQPPASFYFYRPVGPSSARASSRAAAPQPLRWDGL